MPPQDRIIECPMQFGLFGDAPGAATACRHAQRPSAYGFLIAERTRFSPSARAGHLGFVVPRPAPHTHDEARA